MSQLCSNSPYPNSDFFINDFFKKRLFRRLFSGGIGNPTYLRGKTREMELVTSLTSCQGILTSFFFSAKNSCHWIGYNYYVKSFYFDEFFRKKLVKLNWLWFLHHCMVFWRDLQATNSPDFSSFSRLQSMSISARFVR